MQLAEARVGTRAMDVDALFGQNLSQFASFRGCSLGSCER